MSILRFFALGSSILLTGCGDRAPQVMSPERPTNRPYCIKGRWYYPQRHYTYCKEGIASYYGGKDGCHGLPTATGKKFNMYNFTGAHKTLPIPCVVKVDNMDNGRSVTIKITDRGPYKNDRIVDVSAQVAHFLGFYHKGTARVRLTTLVEESMALPENQRFFPEYARFFPMKAHMPFYHEYDKMVTHICTTLECSVCDYNKNSVAKKDANQNQEKYYIHIILEKNRQQLRIPKGYKVTVEKHAEGKKKIIIGPFTTEKDMENIASIMAKKYVVYTVKEKSMAPAVQGA